MISSLNSVIPWTSVGGGINILMAVLKYRRICSQFSERAAAASKIKNRTFDQHVDQTKAGVEPTRRENRHWGGLTAWTGSHRLHLDLQRPESTSSNVVVLYSQAPVPVLTRMGPAGVWVVRPLEGPREEGLHPKGRSVPLRLVRPPLKGPHKNGT